MNPESKEDWLDRVAARRATPGQRRQWLAELSALPAEQRRMARELALNDLLDGHRPAPPVSSNFTARVVAEALRSTPALPRRARLDWHALLTIPRIAFTAVALVVAALGWQGLELREQRQIARGTAEVGRTTEAVGLDADSLADFDVIRHLGTKARPEDDALMVALAQ